MEVKRKKHMEVNEECAKELVALSMEQETAQALETLKPLQDFCEESLHEDVAVELAKGLVSLCGRVPTTMEKQMAYGGLSNLGTVYWESKAVVTEQAKGILTLCAGLDEMYAMAYKAQLQGLLFAYPELNELIETYQPNGN